MILSANNIVLLFTSSIFYGVSSSPTTLNAIGFKDLIQDGLLKQTKSFGEDSESTINFAQFDNEVHVDNTNGKFSSDEAGNGDVVVPDTRNLDVAAPDTAARNGDIAVPDAATRNLEIAAPDTAASNVNKNRKESIEYSPIILSSNRTPLGNITEEIESSKVDENDQFVSPRATEDENQSIAGQHQLFKGNSNDIQLLSNQNGSVESRPILSSNPPSSFTSSNANESQISTKTGGDQNATCHSLCLSDLNKMAFNTIPNSEELILTNSSLTLECTLPMRDDSSVRLIWLFQGVNPPRRQCSLTPQETLASCGSFTSTDHYIDANITSGYTKEILILKNLTTEHSGYYYCMVELFCSCSNQPHIMDRTIGTKTAIKIYIRTYGIQIIILIGANMFLLLLIACGMFLKRRKRNSYYVSLLPYESSPRNEENDSLCDSEDTDS